MESSIEKMLIDFTLSIVKSLNEPRVVIQRHHMVGKEVTMPDPDSDNDNDEMIVTIIDVYIDHGDTYYLCLSTDGQLWSTIPEDLTRIGS